MQNQNPLSLVFTVKPVFGRESYENVDLKFFQGWPNFHWPKIHTLSQQPAFSPSLYRLVFQKAENLL